jgi:hypothetical protein
VIPSAKVNLLANWPNILPSRVNFQGHDFFKPNPIHGEDVVYLRRGPKTTSGGSWTKLAWRSVPF